MRRIALLLGLAALVIGAALYLRRPASAKSPKPSANANADANAIANANANANDPAPTPAPEPESDPAADPATDPATAPAPAADVIATLDSKSDAFFNHLEVVLPNTFQGAAAKCLRPGLPRDQKVKLEYRLHIADGEIYADNVRVISSTLDDRTFERCAIDAVAKHRFRNPQLPDWESTEQLLLRIRALKQYVDDTDE